MKTIGLILTALLFSESARAQVVGPVVNQLFVEAFPINSANASVATITTVDYNIKAVEVSQLRITVLGFVDLEPAGNRKFYFTNHDQIIRHMTFPVGLMIEEAANRTGSFTRIGPASNLNELPIIRSATRHLTKTLNVSWLKAVSGNIQDEFKIYLASREVSIGLGYLGAEGFYRIRYGSGGNFGQPQLTFRSDKPKWLKVVVELEQNGRNWDTYIGLRATLIGAK